MSFDKGLAEEYKLRIEVSRSAAHTTHKKKGNLKMCNLKTVKFGLLASAMLMLGGSIFSATDAEAVTCAQRARFCEIKGGHGCSDPGRMAACRANGYYSAPNGNTWPVDGQKSRKTVCKPGRTATC